MLEVFDAPGRTSSEGLPEFLGVRIYEHEFFLDPWARNRTQPDVRTLLYEYRPSPSPSPQARS